MGFFGITGFPKEPHKSQIVRMLAATVSALKRAQAVLPEEEGCLAPKGRTRIVARHYQIKGRIRYFTFFLYSE